VCARDDRCPNDRHDHGQGSRDDDATHAQRAPAPWDGRRARLRIYRVTAEGLCDPRRREARLDRPKTGDGMSELGDRRPPLVALFS
jgi:hypothetical protein